jgi:hypothetical protein
MEDFRSNFLKGTVKKTLAGKNAGNEWIDAVVDATIQ